MSKSISHIAVIRLSAMGDVAMIVPVLRAFVKQHPDVKITMISRPFFKPFFDCIPNLQFFEVDLNKRHKGLAGLFRLYADLQKDNIDAVADLHNVLRSKVLRMIFSLNGKKIASIDKGRREKKALTRLKQKIFIPLKPTSERYADVFRKLGFKLDLSLPEYPEKAKFAVEILPRLPQNSSNLIGIAPFAKHQGKIYPTNLMHQVISALAQNANNTVFLFGAGEDEIKILDSFAKGLSNVMVTAGEFSFTQELALISNLDVMLSMDSGNAHIAAMYGVQTITLWGATHPYAGFAPFGQPNENALIADRLKFPLLPTSIYGNKEVPGYEDAMRTISPETIVQKIQSILKQKTP